MKVDFYICPHCGAEVRVGSKGCNRCASERATKNWHAPAKRRPWEQDETYDGLDLPDDEFDYEKFVAEEFEEGPPRAPRQWLWALVATIVLLALLALIFAGGWFGS